MTSPRLPSVALAMALMLTLGGCTVFPEQDAPRMFTLPESDITPSAAAPTSITLRVDTPLTPAPFDTARIVVLKEPGELALYGGSRWRDQAPVLVRDQLVEGFRQDGRLLSVITEQSRTSSDRSLIGEMSRFRVLVPADGQSRVQVRLDLQLLDDRSRETLAARRFEVEEPTDGLQVEDAVAAFGRASQRLVEQVVDWAMKVQ